MHIYPFSSVSGCTEVCELKCLIIVPVQLIASFCEKAAPTKYLARLPAYEVHKWNIRKIREVYNRYF